MNMPKHPDVAVLIATYNGSRDVETQIRSLGENVTPFTLHWLDDHSSDNTRDIVRATALSAGIELREWHQPRHHGFPGVFFQLLNCVDADIYLFCDQDDIWQRGKIDAAVANLVPDIKQPVFCYSDPLLFFENEPKTFYRVSDLGHTKVPAILEPARAFLSSPAAGQSVGITRPLREMYLQNKDIAQTHGMGHSWWLYILATVAGTVRFLPDVPTTLHRQHGNNFSGSLYPGKRSIVSHIATKWRLHNYLRRGAAQQAKGFILASATLPPGPKLKQLLEIAQLVTTVDRRQSPVAIARLLLRHAMWPWWYHQFWFTVSCLLSNANAQTLNSPVKKTVNPPAQNSESRVAQSEA